MPRQSLAAMKVAFRIREQSGVLTALALLLVVQISGVIIFSSSARAVGVVSYSYSLTSSPLAMSAPRSIVTDSSGNVYVADDGNGYIRKFDSSGNYILGWQVYTPTSYNVNSNLSSMFLSIGPNGNVYVAPNDISTRNVNNSLNLSAYDADGNLVAMQPMGTSDVDALAVAPDGTKFVITDGSLATVNFGSYSTIGIGASADAALAVTDSKIYIVEGGAVSIYDYSDYSLLAQYNVVQYTSPPTNPTQPSIVVDDYGFMYITDNSNAIKMSPGGQTFVSWGSTGTDSGEFINPGGIALGASNQVYIADRYVVGAAYGTRVQVFDDASFDLAVTTDAPNGAGSTSKSLRGSTNDSDDVWSATYSFEYGPTTSYGSVISSSLNTVTTFESNATGLTCETQYHYRAKGVANGVTVYGDDVTFTTGLCPGNFAITTTSLPNGVVGTGYSQTITTNSAGSPFIYVISGALPDGLSLSSGGDVTGTPTQTGTYNFTVQAFDNNSIQSDNQEYTVTITDAYVPFAIITTTLPGGQVGAVYSQPILTDSASSITFSLASGSLPGGLSLSGAGVISGTPTNDGSFNFVVSATDTISTDTQALEIIVDPQDSVVDPQDPAVPEEEVPIDEEAPPEEAPSITDVTPQDEATEAPGASSPIRSPQAVVAAQNNLFALAKRIPEPFAVGLPWLLLLLALILISIQYYQVHNESITTRRIQAYVLHQEQLVEEQNNFVALTTHYLHTPLTVMEGEITLMVKAGTLSQEQATKLKATLSSLNNQAESVLAQEEQNESIS